MNGGSGIQPTVELATTGNAYPYPVMYGGNGYGGSGFFGGDGIWAIILLALLFGWGNNGNGNGWMGGRGFDDGYAWLSNGQKDIMNQTSDGFNTLHLSNQLEGTRDGINALSTQLCGSTADIVAAINNGFYSSEIAAANRQMADMQQSYALSTQLANCCCENRLGIANLNSTILAENCADRAALQEGVRDIITNQTASTQRILDQLCQDKIDAKNEKINDLQREILMKDLQASQTAQTATLRLGQEAEVDALYNRLSNCPVPTVPVYGRQPIFTCNNNGCGCGYSNSLYGVNV
jgi:hypothetical protein